MIVSLAVGIFAAGIAIISQYWGMKEKNRAMEACGQVLLLSIIAGTPLALTGYFLTGPFLVILGVPEDTLPFATVYARLIALGIPFMAIYESFAAIYNATGNTITPIKMRTTGVFLNIILDPILIFGYFGLPQLCVGGAAIATVLSQATVSALCLTYLKLKGLNGLSFSLKYLKPRPELIKKMGKIGYPISALTFGEASGFVVLIHVISMLGSAPLAAWGVADRLLGLFHVFVAGLLGATSTMIGQNLGAGLTKRAREIAKKTALYGTTIMLVGILAIIPFRYQVSAFFAPQDEELIKQAGDFLLIMGPSVIFFTLYLASGAVAHGSGHTKPVMAFGLLRLWVLRNILAYLFGPGPIGWGVVGLWIGMAISNYITGSLALWWILFGRWDKPVVEKEK